MEELTQAAEPPERGEDRGDVRRSDNPDAGSMDARSGRGRKPALSGRAGFYVYRLRSLRRQGSNATRLIGWSRAAGPRISRGAGSVAVESGAGDRVPVVLCVWKRVDRLERTIALLGAQTHPGVELHIWNNNRRCRSEVDSIVRATAGLPVRVTHSSRNVGGFGRFYLARQLAARHPYVLFIDDDLTFSESMVEELMSEARSGSITSSWAYRFTSANDYWSRVPAAPGEAADYCGTCGMVADTRVFLETGLFSCPRRFWFVEDLWLSFYAEHVLNWELRKSKVISEVDDDGRDQYLYLRGKKSALLEHLVLAGWDIPARVDRRS